MWTCNYIVFQINLQESHELAIVEQSKPPPSTIEVYVGTIHKVGYSHHIESDKE